MVHDQFPMFKLITLLARQISAPIAKNIKEYAKNHPIFERQVCGRLAWLYKECELRYKLWSLQIRTVKGHTPHVTLSKQQEIDIAGDILGEMVLFTLGACIVIFEVNRQAANKEIEVLEEKSRWLALTMNLEELQTELRFQQDDINRLYAQLKALQKAKTEGNHKSPPDDSNR